MALIAQDKKYLSSSDLKKIQEATTKWEKANTTISNKINGIGYKGNTGIDPGFSYNPPSNSYGGGMDKIGDINSSISGKVGSGYTRNNGVDPGFSYTPPSYSTQPSYSSKIRDLQNKVQAKIGSGYTGGTGVDAGFSYNPPSASYDDSFWAMYNYIQNQQDLEKMAKRRAEYEALLADLQWGKYRY